MATLRLNFLPINKSDFSFNIYRKISADKNSDFYNCYLPVSEEEETKSNYLVSFESIAGFESYTANSYNSISLTKKYILQKFISQLQLVDYKVFPYEVTRRFASESVDFTIKDEQPKGKKVVSLTPYFFEEQGKFGFLINFFFKKNQGVPFDREVQRLSLSLDNNYRSNKNYYSDQLHIIETFITKNQDFFSHLIFNDEENKSCITATLAETSSFSLEKKEYIFGNHKSSFSQFQGIKSFGPYTPIANEVLFVFIFEEKFKTFANSLYLSLLGKSNPGTFLGLEAMFKIKLGLNNTQSVLINGYDKTELQSVIDKVKKIKAENSTKQIISLFIEDYNEEISTQEINYYYQLKYKFIQEDIPLQFINYKNLGEKNSLKWSTSNIALAMFSKLGGIPWIVKPSNNNCLILGIGSAHKKDATGKIVKYFAYTVCLDSSGIYKQLEVLADDNDRETYLVKLQSKLKSLFTNGTFTNYTSCVLHLPFKIKRKEIEAISNAIKEIKQINFVTVKINTDNKFFGYSFHNTHVPYESSCLKLSKQEYLVWFEGLLYGKEIVDKRLANPVHIEFLNLTDNKSLDHGKYLQDVLNLSGANWRGFNAKSIPISIYYSQLIAKYTKAFENIEGYNEDILSNKNPWFL